jgi:hypothetical protein
MELSAQRFAVEVFRAFDGVALLDGAERGGVFGQLVHLQRDGLSAPRVHVDERPPVRRAVRQLDIVFHSIAPVHERGDLAFGAPFLIGRLR